MISQRGFTLIETLVYLGLFAIIMVGVISVAYVTFEGNGRLQTKNLIQEEGDFLLAKLNRFLTGATSVATVASPVKLTITRSAAPTSVIFDMNGIFLEIKDPTANNLNNSGITVSSLTFTDSGGGTPVESVTATFTLQAKTPTGQTYSQDFTTTKYLRK